MASREHLTDEQLLLFVDGECSPREAKQAQQHLEICAECRARKQQFEAASDIFHDLRGAGDLKMEAEPRAVFRERLAAAQPAPGQTKLSVKLYRYASLATAAALLVILEGRTHLFQHRPVETAEARLLPDSGLTPGATRPVDVAALCASQDDDLDPAVPSSTKEQVLEEYGVSDNSANEYQVDYLINPQLGGTSDVRNLWPEPYQSKVWNARAKDALETQLHQMVCERQIDLASAQREISTDWIAAYKKYVRRNKPA